MKHYLLAGCRGWQVYVALQQEAEEAGLPPPGPEAAFTYELCAGLVDKSSSLQQIAAEEVLPQYLSH